MVRIGLTIGIFAFASVGWAQTGNATVSGTVVDTSKAVIPGAQVNVTSVRTGVVRTTQTTGAGFFVVPELNPGEYLIEVTAKGFEAKRYSGVVLSVNQQAQIDVTLTAGSEKQVVQVAGDSVPILQTVEASVGTVVNSKSVVNLPLNGRFFTQLLQLSPGTVPAIRDIPSGNNFRNGTQRNGMPAFGVNGQSGAYTNFRIDGIENAERQFGGANIAVSVDAIEEFKFQTANFSAEYGQGPAQVDVVTKSGGNGLHGTLFHFLRNDKFDASQWAFSGPKTPPLLKRNQFGGSIGGPVKKDKLFYFFNYEGTREVFSSPQILSVPSNDQRRGIFPAGNVIFDPRSGQPFPDNRIPLDRFDPVAVKVLQVLPAPNLAGNPDLRGGLPISQSNNFLYVPRKTFSANQYNARVDYARSSRDTFSGRYTYASNHQVGDGPLATNIQGSIVGSDIADIGGQNLSGSWYHTFSSTMINEFRGGFLTNPQNYLKGDNTDYAAQFGLASALSPNAYKGLPRFNFGLPTGTVTLSSGEARPLVSGENNFELVENLTIIKGSHSIKVGGQMRRTNLFTENSNFSTGAFTFNGAQTRNRATVTFNGRTINLGANGTTFCPGGSDPTACPAGNAFADFLLGYLASFSTRSPVERIDRYAGIWAGYVNDSWRVNRKLTLNFGLRYDYYRRPVANPHSYAQPEIVNGRFTGRIGIAEQGGQLSPRLLPSALQQTPGVFVGCSSIGVPSDSCLASQKNNWQPRAGFAWQPTSKSVIRGAAGIFVGRWGGNQENEVGTNNYPFVSSTATPTYTVPPAGNAPPPLLLANPLATAGAAAPNVQGHDPFRKLPVTYQFNLTLEHQLPGDISASAGYVSVLGRHIADGGTCCIYNAFEPSGVVLAPGQTQRRADTRFANVAVTTSRNTSSYQSLQMQATRRFSRGLTFTTAYTYSKNTGVTVGRSDPRFPAIDRGPLDTDLRHNLVVSSVFELPFGPGRKLGNVEGVAGYLIKGWQVTGIMSKRSGFPITPTLAGTDLLLMRGLNRVEDRPDRVCSGRLSNPTVFRWFDKSCFVLPVQSTTPGALLRQGNSGVNILYGPGGFNLDLGLTRQFVIREGKTLDFRAESFNVLNHPTFGFPDASINPSGASTPARITSTISTARTMQLALRFRF